MQATKFNPIAIAIVILIFVFAPTRPHRTPAYDVWVVSESGNQPLAGVAVTERYGFDKPQTLTSDAQGHVRFESRLHWTSLAHRLFARSSDKPFPATTGFTTIHAVGLGLNATDEKMSWTGHDMGLRITMHPAYIPTPAYHSASAAPEPPQALPAP